MEQTAEILLTIGGFLVLGMATDYLGHRTFLPRVTLLLLFGILIGPEALDIVPDTFINQFELVANMTLLMVAFLLGGKLTRKTLASTGNLLISLSLNVVIITMLVVTLVLWLTDLPPELAIILGCLATATAPAATVDVVEESGIKGRFPDMLVAVVAIDDAWALIIFSLGLALITTFAQTGAEISPLMFALREIGGAVLVGTAIGLPASFLTGRIRKGRPMLTEALGLVFICGGLAIWLEFSFLIASMVMGAIIANCARHHEHAFHEIENIEWPFMILFFALAGVSLEIGSLSEIGLIGLAYIAGRIAGKVLGALLGGAMAGGDKDVRNWMGLALLPQAGVNMGMALVASNLFPEHRQTILSLVISTTVFFELFGPICTRLALKHAASTSTREL